MKVISCFFDDCSTGTDYGGGIAAQHLANVYIYSSLFTKCHGQDIGYPHSGGGAVYLEDTKQSHHIYGCALIGCYSGADGGGANIRNSAVAEPDCFANTRFIDCKTLYQHSSVEGGAAQCHGGAMTCSFSNCLISNCESYQGGGLYLLVKENSVTNIISFCFFNDNSANEYGNDISMEYFSTENDEFFLLSFSTSQFTRIANWVNGWSNLSDDWLPQGIVTYPKMEYRSHTSVLLTTPWLYNRFHTKCIFIVLSVPDSPIKRIFPLYLLILPSWNV